MKNLAISLFGVISSVIVVAILVFLELEWEFAFYSVLHFFVIPTGAIIAGMGAASGYYVGALILNAKPTSGLLAYMVAISIGAYFALNYVTYLLLEVDGVAVSSYLDFADYMDIVLTNMSMTIGRGNADTGELGNLGYVVALLQIIGFAGGGVAVFLFLKGKAYCDLCSKYYKTVWQDARYYGADDSDKLMESIKNIAAALDDADLAGARERHNEVGMEKSAKNSHLRTQLTLKECPECARQLMSFETSKEKGSDWEVIADLSLRYVHPGRKDTAAA